MCLGVNRHLVSGHEISRLKHGLQLIMARYTRIINCRPCCNLYVMYVKNIRFREQQRTEIFNFSCVQLNAKCKLDGCIVWNAHNTVFGSKRSAICATV